MERLLQGTCILTSDTENILQIVESEGHLRIIIQRYYSNTCTATLNLSQFYKHLILAQSCLNVIGLLYIDNDIATQSVVDDVCTSVKAIFAYYVDCYNRRIAFAGCMYGSSDINSNSNSDNDNVNNSKTKDNKETMNKYKYMNVHESRHTVCKLIGNRKCLININLKAKQKELIQILKKYLI